MAALSSLDLFHLLGLHAGLEKSTLTLIYSYRFYLSESEFNFSQSILTTRQIPHEEGSQCPTPTQPPDNSLVLPGSSRSHGCLYLCRGICRNLNLTAFGGGKFCVPTTASGLEELSAPARAGGARSPCCGPRARGAVSSAATLGLEEFYAHANCCGCAPPCPPPHTHTSVSM